MNSMIVEMIKRIWLARVEMIKRAWLARVEIAMRCWSGWREGLARKEEQVNDQEKLFRSKEQAGGAEVHVGRCC